jgi:hypothetical protein
MTEKKNVRAIWPLLKARVVERTDAGIKLAIGGSTTITITHDMRLYDVREGDLLTLYTEVLLNAENTGTKSS